MLIIVFLWDVQYAANNFECRCVFKANKWRYEWLQTFEMLKQRKLKVKTNSIDRERQVKSYNFRLLTSLIYQFPFKSLWEKNCLFHFCRHGGKKVSMGEPGCMWCPTLLGSAQEQELGKGCGGSSGFCLWPRVCPREPSCPLCLCSIHHNVLFSPTALVVWEFD